MDDVSAPGATLEHSAEPPDAEQHRLRITKDGPCHAKLLDQIFDHTLDSIVVLDPLFNFVRVSETYARDRRRPMSDLIGRNHFDLYPSPLRDKFEEVKRNKTIFRCSAYPNVFPSEPGRGTTYWDLSLVPMLDTEGEVDLFLFTVRDVTEKKRAEDETIHTRDLLRFVLDSSPDYIFIKDTEHRFLLVNQAFAKSIGRSQEEMLGRRDIEIFPKSSIEGDPESGIRSIRHEDEMALLGRSVSTVGTHTWPMDQSQRVFNRDKLPLKDEHGSVYAVLTRVRDVTQEHVASRALIESANSLKASLEEREQLLREIHHRVKNNLQILSSLIHFHARKTSRPEEQSVLADFRRRVMAMSLVHEKLYQSKHISLVDCGDYLRSLVGVLRESFALRQAIFVELLADQVLLPIELALPVGMLVCELVTNALKYAFPDASEGKVTITIRIDESHVVLCASDNGVGFPKEISATSGGGFGFELIRSLVAQLRGDLTIGTHQGAHVQIRFPAPPGPPEDTGSLAEDPQSGTVR